MAAFAYALAHTTFYVVDLNSLGKTLSEASRLKIWTGWLAFIIFIPLAATSMDSAVRALGRRWKTLQRFVYAAAILTLLHWAELQEWGGTRPAQLHFLPVGLLTLYRLWHNTTPRQRVAV